MQEIKHSRHFGREGFNSGNWVLKKSLGVWGSKDQMPPPLDCKCEGAPQGQGVMLLLKEPQLLLLLLQLSPTYRDFHKGIMGVFFSSFRFEDI